ncbi:serine/threonine protein kinase PRKX, putative [Entamoeba invadens IP1]|uniref:Serine/threonine protein kinase PRKX, putative n=2 Tax=Entamoeba invadens TaxID=33085 RepID=A0A0A1TUL7_ENTIV|nr:serine/threonine protein kinase PRKX, putative [Entamoeba invadens IP1]ELP83760.1 serine/threonine protein kinase PRKX, putative [Entamoeba invadens IP1]BAN41993.1 serine/threonine protein kinase PRKX, putative [Entamoeba invadens]|eukprot:XP_004183106.1 serine/threonine protein kinase PRKX, putative [Entamoeba invadens IP1]
MRRYISQALSEKSFVSSQCSYQTIVLSAEYIRRWNTRRRLRLIEFGLNGFDSQKKNAIKNAVKRYQKRHEESNSVSKVSKILHKTIPEDKFFIFTEQPIGLSVDEYYATTHVSEIEFNTHVSQLKEIENEIGDISDIDDLTLSIFEVDDSPFPSFKTTVFSVLKEFMDTQIVPRSPTESEESHNVPISNSHTVQKLLFTLHSQRKTIEQRKESLSCSCPPQLDLNKYTEEEIIGQGRYGIVKLMGKPSGERIVVKESVLKTTKFLEKEAKIMTMCDHRNIVKCVGYTTYHNEIGEVGVLGIEECDCDLKSYVETLRERGKKLRIEEAEDIFAQISAGCIYLYKTFGIVHRDLKPQNILINVRRDGICVKLCDFGMAVKGYDKMWGRVGSPVYAAPEVVREEEFGENSDLYSLGVILFYLLFMRIPFDVDDLDELKKVFARGVGPVIGNSPDECVVKKLMEFDRSRRVGWKEFEKMRFGSEIV